MHEALTAANAPAEAKPEGWGLFIEQEPETAAQAPVLPKHRDTRFDHVSLSVISQGELSDALRSDDELVVRRASREIARRKAHSRRSVRRARKYRLQRWWHSGAGAEAAIMAVVIVVMLPALWFFLNAIN